MKSIHILTLLLGIFLLSCANSSQSEKEVSDFRIMTYNIRNCRGLDDSVSVDRTASVINNIKPYVVAVQEIDSVTGRSQGKYILGELVARTGMIPVFSPAIDYDGGKYGTGVLCTEKPKAVYRRDLPGTEEKRTLIVVEFDKFCFASTHFSLTESDRIKSAALIKDFISKFDKPVIVAGDWNDEPESAFLNEMKKTFRILSKAEEYTFPASEPSKTIDYIAVSEKHSEKLSLKDVKVVDAPVESDHRPLVAEISVE